MLYFMGLFLAALCGWTVGRSVGGKGLGAVTDILLGITGAMTVRFFFDALQVTVQGIVVFLCSLSGAAALPALVELLLGRSKPRASVRAPQAPILMGTESRQFTLRSRRPRQSREGWRDDGRTAKSQR